MTSVVISSQQWIVTKVIQFPTVDQYVYQNVSNHSPYLLFISAGCPDAQSCHISFWLITHSQLVASGLCLVSCQTKADDIVFYVRFLYGFTMDMISSILEESIGVDDPSIHPIILHMGDWG